MLDHLSVDFAFGRGQAARRGIQNRAKGGLLRAGMASTRPLASLLLVLPASETTSSTQPQFKLSIPVSRHEAFGAGIGQEHRQLIPQV
ncbi:hypothetical protein Cv017_15905 [Chromobacterium subtsugae]|nr:hypothetical protein Cv017_15905 [Chromobacterium subtsugae]